MCQIMSPGSYLGRRRRAAGLSTDDVAVLISSEDHWIEYHATQIRLIEMDQHVPPPALVDRLQQAFRFDRRIFDLLVCIGMDMRFCRICGCSDLDRCDTEDAGECAWSTDTANTCTHCARAASIAAPALPFLSERIDDAA